MISVLAVIAHHDLQDFVSRIIGESFNDIGWSSITGQNPAEIKNHGVNLAVGSGNWLF
jgi:hypothetical protein